MSHPTWNPLSPQSWAKALGLVHVPMFDAAREVHGSQAVLLDGEKASFALLSGNSHSILDSTNKPLEWSWSSNLSHTLLIDHQHQVLVLQRWDDPEVMRRFKLPTESGARELLATIEDARTPIAPGIVDRMLGAFRAIRELVASHDGAPVDAVRAFNAFLLVAQAPFDSHAERGRLRTFDDVLQFSNGSALRELGLSTSALGNVNVEHILPPFLEPDPITGYVMDADLFIRHASGVLYQEAHIELEKRPIRQRSIFNSGATHDVETGAEKSDARFTAPSLARAIAEQAISLWLSTNTSNERITILDPACGSGAFLVEALREMATVSKNCHLVGFDNSDVACEMASFCLAENGADRVTWEVQLQDSLSPDNSWGEPDVILMNPPFVSWEQLGDERDTVRSILGDLVNVRPDKAMAFVLKAARALKPGGVLATILPAPLLESRGGVRWRNALIEDEGFTLHLIGYFRGFGYFRGATVEPSFIILSKPTEHRREPEPEVQIIIANDGSEGAALRALRRDPEGELPQSSDSAWEVFRMDAECLSPASWMPRSRRSLALVRALEESGLPRLSELFQVKMGIRSGCDRVFILTLNEWQSLDDQERTYFRPVAHTKTIISGKLLKTKFIFYPFGHERTITDESQLREAVPNYYETRLLPSKELLQNRPSLRRREWWSLSEPRETWQSVPQPKIVSTYFGGRGSFSYDEHGEYAIGQGFGWLWNKTSSFHGTAIPWAYVAILNSPLFQAVLSNFCPRVSGGQFDFSARFVDRAFLPDLSDPTRISSDLVGDLECMGRQISTGVFPDLVDLDRAAARAFRISTDDF